VRNSLPERGPLLQAYVEALAQAQREPTLRAQLAGHVRAVRMMVAERAAQSLGDGTVAEDPRCQAVASFVMAVCDGLAVQYLLDPDQVPSGDQLLAGLTMAFAASFPAAPDRPPLSGSSPR
jgi:hypothetical protein